MPRAFLLRGVRRPIPAPKSRQQPRKTSVSTQQSSRVPQLRDMEWPAGGSGRKKRKGLFQAEIGRSIRPRETGS
jgi:hypothetical protein